MFRKINNKKCERFQFRHVHFRNHCELSWENWMFSFSWKIVDDSGIDLDWLNDQSNHLHFDASSCDLKSHLNHLEGSGKDVLCYSKSFHLSYKSNYKRIRWKLTTIPKLESKIIKMLKWSDRIRKVVRLGLTS